MGSVSQRFATPGFAAYSLSKSAVHSFTCALRREMFKFGVQVVEIEPDAYKTPLSCDEMVQKFVDKSWSETDEAVRRDYSQRYYQMFKQFVRDNLHKARDYPEEVVRAMEEAVTSANPDEHYLVCGPHNRVIIWLFDLLPGEWLEFLVKMYLCRLPGREEDGDRELRSQTSCRGI